MLYHNQMEVLSAADQLGVDLCNAAEALSHQGEYDYTLQSLASAVGGMETPGDSITRDDVTIQMDGDIWKEMGNQYSLRKQWWPIKD